MRSTTVSVTTGRRAVPFNLLPGTVADQDGTIRLLGNLAVFHAECLPGDLELFTDYHYILQSSSVGFKRLMAAARLVGAVMGREAFALQNGPG